jgi:hypothetical protein
MQTILVQADYYGAIPPDDTVRLLHACAGCRDPYFHPTGMLSLAFRFYPKQLLESDEKGRCPLYIAVSTVLRDTDGNPFADEEEDDGDWMECEEYLKKYNDFINGICPPKGVVCDCDEKFRAYNDMMTHRLDKKETIHWLLKACPQAAGRRDMEGNLPLANGGMEACSL